jgi:hypothetical protein
MGEKLELPKIISPHNITFDACSEKKNPYCDPPRV